VVVAVIDTGIQLDHPDLASNIWVNPGEIANNNVDDDNNGFIDDVHGWDFWNWDNDPDDDDGHGTHVAGTIGAVINNGVGVSGIAPNVRLMALKVFNAHGDAYSNDIYSALEYAVTNGVQISNNSYGSYGKNPQMGALIDAAARVGHVFVSAAGNEENNNDISPSFPASYPNDSIISVGATDQSGQMASFSNYGRESVDVAAPGRDILSTINNSGYGWMSGTSMAAPHVTGLVALMRSIEPNLTPSAIREILIETSRFDSRLQNLVGSNGTVDAAAAVRAITQSLIPTTTTAPSATTTRATPTTAPVPTTTRATPTTAPVPTTTAGYTHPSRLQMPQVGTPYLYQSSNQYAVLVSWNPPAQSGSSAVETYEISGGSETWTISGDHQSITALNVYSGNQRFRVRAINFDNRAGDWSPYSVYVSVPTIAAPPTTTPLPPYYALYKVDYGLGNGAEGFPKGPRWDPCSGPVRIAINPNGFLNQVQVADWESKLRQWSAEITQASGLAVVYAGQTDLTPRPKISAEGRYALKERSLVDILIYWGPPADPDTSISQFGDSSQSVDAFRGRTMQEFWADIGAGKARWDAYLAYDIHIHTHESRPSRLQPGANSKYLMYFLGQAFGLAPLSLAKNLPYLQIGNVPDGGLPDDFKTEMMVFGGWGSGTSSDPKWGPGDLIGFGLVGADNGCIQFWD
jgi:subtilisin family serine protease